ncbi:tigger transposable element-derived protein 6 [Caerostris extrusa]|nr:tigger transposable element-derived protein 6 [Caerostris extrusa]
MTMPFPNLLGACGRSVILEGGLKPLKAFLPDSFDTRAGLAVQVLQLVEDFENMHEFSCLLPAMRKFLT